MNIEYRDIARLMAEQPDLLIDGFQYKLPRGGDGFDSPRKLLLTGEFLGEVQTAADYIEAQGIPPKVGSYRIKHDAEKALDCYLPNGAVIAAALLAGYQAERDPHSPNCTFTREAAHA